MFLNRPPLVSAGMMTSYGVWQREGVSYKDIRERNVVRKIHLGWDAQVTGTRSECQQGTRSRGGTTWLWAAGPALGWGPVGQARGL